jgi:hypothetical protein
MSQLVLAYFIVEASAFYTCRPGGVERQPVEEMPECWLPMLSSAQAASFE